MNLISPGRLLQIVETIVLTVIAFLVIQGFVVQPYRIQQISMQNTLQDGQMVLVDRLTPRVDGYSRGDIVVFRPPASAGEGDTPFIKRVIGVAGDVVQLTGGVVTVDGVPLDESSYVFGGQPTNPIGRQTRWVVPAGMLFVLGDHRENSTDSRSASLGPIAVDSVIGKAVMRYWPPSQAAFLVTPNYPTIPATIASR